MTWPIGSTWGRWDLHVHTPLSLVHQYPGDATEAWEAFLVDLEALPADFRVIGINDYMFVDGYRKLLEARQNGRLQNIETLLPVIELRVDKFGGTEGALRRVNLHVIFSEEIPPDLIEQQFIGALPSKFQLSPRHAGNVTWNQLYTRESLQLLGREIKATVPPGELSHFGSGILEGFNNLTISLRDVLDTVARFDGKALVAVGKTEWASIKWNDQSIADKKTVINSADLVFTAVESPDHFRQSRAALTAALVNDRLLDCSDAHHLSSSADKDRIGNCLTWINAIPTFEGLRHALNEYSERVFVGEEPPLVERQRQYPTRFIRSIAVRPVDPSEPHPWFDMEIPTNPSFVVLYGGKGQGKSALADVISLAASSSREADFSFLTEERFRDPKENKSTGYEATLAWESGHETTINLNDRVQAGTSDLVQYIPQNFLEVICNALPSGELGLFDEELGRVVFSHVPDEERLSQTSLSALLRARTTPIYERIADLRETLGRTNAQVVLLEEDLTPVRSAQATARVRKEQHQAKVESLPSAILENEAGIEHLTFQLDEPNRRFQAAVAARAEWERARASLEGATDTPDSIAGLRHALATLDAVPARLAELRATRIEVTREIHRELLRIADIFRSVYRPVEDFIARNALIRDEMGLNFEVSLVANAAEQKLLYFLNQAVSGSFMGIDEGTETIRKLVAATDLNDEAQVVALVSGIEDFLLFDKRPGRDNRPMYLPDQLRRGIQPNQVWDALFGLTYLEPRFVLQSRGRPLDRLSPGEKGTLLLLFYLLVDRRDTPLIIDQPEENLDNETIFQLLVGSLKEAKHRRQLIVVTHNPNLAVVGDADQFMHATLTDRSFEYVTGALEAIETNHQIVRVLEGTRPAFENRGMKYLP